MIPEQMTALGLSAVDGMAQVWFVDADGRLSGGAAAVNDALRDVWWARPFTWLYPLPGIKQVEDCVYRWVAANRYRLPGGSAQCQIGDEVMR
jgi:predicted DCC family thiol-disulfide oxidoreductase YuxK